MAGLPQGEQVYREGAPSAQRSCTLPLLRFAIPSRLSRPPTCQEKGRQDKRLSTIKTILPVLRSKTSTAYRLPEALGTRGGARTTTYAALWSAWINAPVWRSNTTTALKLMWCPVAKRYLSRHVTMLCASPCPPKNTSGLPSPDCDGASILPARRCRLALEPAAPAAGGARGGGSG
jgi:hypothetical protein